MRPLILKIFNSPSLPLGSTAGYFMIMQRHEILGQYTGNCYDPVVIVHEVSQHRGFVLGNEAPGVMKRTSAFLKPDQLTIGLTHSDQIFGFRKWLKPGEPWESTWVFTRLFMTILMTLMPCSTAR